MVQVPCEDREIVWVVWVDAVNLSTRVHYEAVRDCSCATNVNVGWVVDENDKRIVLAHGKSSTGEIDVFVIPVENIIERKQVGKQTRRGKKNV